MRLSCPNCFAEYEVASGLVPATGRHVQCSACHTRWFARPEAPAAQPSEDEIIHRLAARAPVPTGSTTVFGPVREDGEAAEAAADTGSVVAFAARTETASPASDQPPSEAASTPPEAAEASAPSVPKAATAAPEPEARLKAEAAGEGAAARTPSEVDRSRLDLTHESGSSEPLAAPRSRFGHGFAIAVLCLLLAFATYTLHDRIAAVLPATRPALDAYAAQVDAVRERIDQAISNLTARPTHAP